MSRFFKRSKPAKTALSVDTSVPRPISRPAPLPADLVKEMTEFRNTLLLLIRRLNTVIDFNNDVIGSILSYMAHQDAAEEDLFYDAVSELSTRYNLPEATFVQCQENDENIKKNVMQNILALIALSENTFELIREKTQELDQLDCNIQDLMAAIKKEVPGPEDSDKHGIGNRGRASSHRKDDVSKEDINTGRSNIQKVYEITLPNAVVITLPTTIENINTVSHIPVQDEEEEDELEDDLSWGDSTESDPGFDDFFL